MKRLLLLPIMILLVIFLSACTDSADTLKPNKDHVIVDIKNNANFAIYGLEVNVYKNEDLKTTQGSMNADGSKVKKGESLRFEFTEQDFNLKGESTLEVVIVDKDNKNEISINRKITLELTKGKEYFFEVFGDSKTNTDLKRVK